MAQLPDYLGAMGILPNPTQAIEQGIAASLQDQAMRAKIEADQRAQVRERQKQADLARVLANPTADGFARIQALYPEDREAFKSAWETRSEDVRQADLRELSGIHGYLQNGMPEKAIARLDRRIAADKAAGRDTAEDEEVKAAILADPRRAAGAVAYMLSSIVGPEQFASALKNVGEDVRAEEAQPSALRKAGAEAIKLETEAAYAPQVIESDLASEAATRARQAAQTAIEQGNLELGWEKLSLDKDTLATNTQLKLEEMLQAGTEVKGASLDEMTKAVGSAQQNEALADRTRSLADRVEASNIRGGGWRSWAGEALSGAFGNQDPVSALRAEYQQIVNSQAIKNLPPGPATDRDIEIAKQGFPPPTANKEYITSFLRGLSKLQDAAAKADQRRADWISANGNIGTAKRDINVGGVQVPAGTTFGEFNRNTVKRGKAGEAPARGYLERYGKAPPAAYMRKP